MTAPHMDAEIRFPVIAMDFVIRDRFGLKPSAIHLVVCRDPPPYAATYNFPIGSAAAPHQVGTLSPAQIAAEIASIRGSNPIFAHNDAVTQMALRMFEDAAASAAPFETEDWRPVLASRSDDAARSALIFLVDCLVGIDVNRRWRGAVGKILKSSGAGPDQ